MPRKKIYNTGLSKSSIFSSKGKSSGYRPINADARRLIKPIDDTTVSNEDRSHRKHADAMYKGYPKELRHLYIEGLLEPLAKFMKMKIPLEHESLAKIRSGDIPTLKFLKKCRKLRTGLVHHPKRHNLIDLFIHGSKKDGIKPFDGSIFSGRKSNLNAEENPKTGKKYLKMDQAKVEKNQTNRKASARTPITKTNLCKAIKITLPKLCKIMKSIGLGSKIDDRIISPLDAKLIAEVHGYALSVTHSSK